jgi:hypothetical protein
MIPLSRGEGEKRWRKVFLLQIKYDEKFERARVCRLRQLNLPSGTASLPLFLIDAAIAIAKKQTQFQLEAFFELEIELEVVSC